MNIHIIFSCQLKHSVYVHRSSFAPLHSPAKISYRARRTRVSRRPAALRTLTAIDKFQSDVEVLADRSRPRVRRDLRNAPSNGFPPKGALAEAIAHMRDEQKNR